MIAATEIKGSFFISRGTEGFFGDLHMWKNCFVFSALLKLYALGSDWNCIQMLLFYFLALIIL